MNFWMALFGIVTLLSAAGVVVLRSPLNSALSLIVTLLSVAVHYALLEAHFLAVIQVMVYAGAIMVLVIFVIMLLGVDGQRRESIGAFNWLVGGLGASSIFAILTYAVSNANYRNPSGVVPDGSAKGLGETLFTDFLFPFELTSFLILAAIVGAVVLGTEKKLRLQPGRGLKAVRESSTEASESL